MKNRKSDLDYCEMNVDSSHDWISIGYEKKEIISRCAYCHQCKREKIQYVINKQSQKPIKQWPVSMISIVIPSFKRKELLKWGLYSLSKQQCPYPFEVIILNDGQENDGTKELCESYSEKFNIKYIYTGIRNKKEEIWRCPGFVLNIGVKQTQAEYIILSCPEIYHFDTFAIKKIIDELRKSKQLLVRPIGLDDQSGQFLDIVKAKRGNVEYKSSFKNITKKLNTEMPFFIGLHKQDFIDIGGYDEDFIGWAYDDTDLIARLKRYNCKFVQTDSTIVHLYHPRHRIGIKNNQKMYKHNQKLYEEKDKTGIIFSNENRVWGDLNAEPIEKKILNLEDYSSKDWNLKSIPKIAHFYWGNDKLPYLRYLSVLSFRKYNPDWEINVYVPKDKYKGKCLDTSESFAFVGENYYSNLKSLNVNIIEIDFKFIDINLLDTNKLSKEYLSRQEVYRSDFLRWHLLYTRGGLWSDMDIMYFKSMTEMDINIKENKKINTVISLHPEYGHSVGFMLSGKSNPYFRYIFQLAKETFNPNDYQSIGVNLLNIKFPNIKAIETQFKTLNKTVKNTDIKTVYAYDATCIPLIYQSSAMIRYSTNSIGLHWYAGHRFAKYYINKLTHLNYSHCDNVLGKTIQLVYNKNIKKEQI